MVARRRRVSRAKHDDIVRRSGPLSQTAGAGVHECCGSPFAPFEPTRRITNVMWGGTRLADLLANCRPARGARYLWSYGADSGEFSSVRIDAFCKDLPMEACCDETVECGGSRS